MSIFVDMRLAAFLGIALVVGPARQAAPAQQTTTLSTSTQVDDSTLRERVAASLKKNATIAARELEVEVNEGVVTLKGAVRTADEKRRAAQLATIKGVTQVRNEVVVDAAAAKTKAVKAVDATKQAGAGTANATKSAAQAIGDKTKELAGKTADKTKEVVSATGDKTKEVVSATGEVITDEWIVTKVKAKFADETLLKNSDINVDAKDHVVTLKGTAASSAAIDRAAAIASGTEGVTRVINQLGVK